MRSAFRYLTSALFVLVVVQVGLAGYGAFRAIDRADKVRLTKKSIESGFDAHGVIGSLIVLVMLALVVAAAAGRLGPAKVKFSGAILGLGVLQLILGAVATSAPAVGFLHGINALAIYAASGLLAHRAWTEARAGAAGGATAPPAPAVATPTAGVPPGA